MRFARAGDSANRWHGVTRWRSQVDADTEAGRGFRATEGAAEVDAHAIIEGFRIADRKRRTPILEAHARSQATIAAGAGASHGHLHRGRGHRPLAAAAIIGAIEAILHLFTELAQALLRSEEHTSELQSLMRISYALY